MLLKKDERKEEEEEEESVWKEWTLLFPSNPDC